MLYNVGHAFAQTKMNYIMFSINCCRALQSTERNSKPTLLRPTQRDNNTTTDCVSNIAQHWASVVLLYKYVGADENAHCIIITNGVCTKSGRESWGGGYVPLSNMQLYTCSTSNIIMYVV